MSAEILRRAASLMRERAEACVPFIETEQWWTPEGLLNAIEDVPGDEQDAAHIASWHPAVALAVADWLDSTANDVAHVHTPVYNLTSTTVARALAVARAYLGESTP